MDKKECTKYKDIIHEIKMNNSDSWGTCCGWMFSLAEWCYENNTLVIPYDWSSGMGGSDALTNEYKTLDEFQLTDEDCERLAKTLHRWYGMLKTAGRNY